jgi:methylglutaconyl-CoA hydratase
MMNARYHNYACDTRGVATVTLNRPEIHNAFDDELIKELTERFSGIDKDPSVRAIVLTGEGKSFCAGADLNWMKRMKSYSDAENYRDSQALAELFHVINTNSKPVIGRVFGAALGGGAGLVSVCDYVVAVESTKIGFTEARLGLLPAVISPFVIGKIGESWARAYFMSGEIFSAKRALEMGLVHQLVTEDELDTQVEKTLKQFLAAGPKAAFEAKKLVRTIVDGKGHKTTQELRDYTCQTISRIRISPEGQEGMAALLEKKKPSWVGEK